MAKTRRQRRIEYHRRKNQEGREYQIENRNMKLNEARLRGDTILFNKDGKMVGYIPKEIVDREAGKEAS